MRKSKITKIIERIAATEGVSVSEVRHDMETAIEHGYANRDETNTAFWARWGGRKPSVEEFLVAVRGETHGKIGTSKNFTKKFVKK